MRRKPLILALIALCIGVSASAHDLFMNGRIHLLDARTDVNGFARIKLTGAGKWYIKFIRMTPLSDPNLNYESKWASLTFEIRNRKR